MDDFDHISHPPPHEKADWVVIAVDILEVATGQHVLYSDEGIFDKEANEVSTYIWAEGNYSCDCTRELFFARALGSEAREDEAWAKEACSEGRFAAQVRSAKTGRVIWTDPLWSPAMKQEP